MPRAREVRLARADVDADPELRVSEVTGAGKAFSADGHAKTDRKALGRHRQDQTTVGHAQGPWAARSMRASFLTAANPLDESLAFD